MPKSVLVRIVSDFSKDYVGNVLIFTIFAHQVFLNPHVTELSCLLQGTKLLRTHFIVSLDTNWLSRIILTNLNTLCSKQFNMIMIIHDTRFFL